MGALAAYHLLGRLQDGNLILLAGPDYIRVRELASTSGIPVLTAAELPYPEDVEDLKGRIARTGESVLVIASMCEVEGRLDRSAFERPLIDLAYGADRVVYAGFNGAVLVHPVARGTRMTATGGSLRVQQDLETVAAGETVVGLTVDRL